MAGCTWLMLWTRRHDSCFGYGVMVRKREGGFGCARGLQGGGGWGERGLGGGCGHAAP